jgi:prepilin peptidase CpaA
VFGKIEIIHVSILAISFVVVITDFLWGKIYNWLTVTSALAGFFMSVYLMGWQGAGQSLLGIVVGFLCYGWMFRLGFMGGGDVKLLMALGAWGGYRYAEEVALLAILVGGGLSLLILTFTGKIIGFLRRFHLTLLSIYVKELEFQPPQVDKTLTMPFGIPISIAAVWAVFSHPLETWGMLWP